MIIFFGPPGAGKSVQGQILAARHGWRWLSTGQLLRDTHDQTIHETMNQGKLVNDESMNRIVAEALKNAQDVENLIIDGFPRKVEQGKWLVENLKKYNSGIDAIILLEVPDDELKKRLHIRGRADDTSKNIALRSQDYLSKTKPVIDYFQNAGIKVRTINGEGSVGSIHDRIEEAVESCLQK